MARKLPSEIRVRLADARSHYRALVFALGRSSVDDYAQALKTREAEALTQHAYPLERPFEILDNYVVELARAGLELAGKDSTGTASAVLTRLHAEGVISEAPASSTRRRQSSSRSCPASSGTTARGCACSASAS